MSAPYAAPAEPPAVLVVTGDGRLADVLQRLAAAAGVIVDLRAVPPSRTAWAEATLVLVGVDLAPAVAAALPRRAGVSLVVLRDGRARAIGGADDEFWQHAVELGAERVAVLPGAQEWVVQALTASVDDRLDCAVIGIVGGSGGAGASVLAAATAVQAARQDRRVLLVDLDPVGGGLDLLIGVEETPGLRWSGLSGARGRVAGSMLRDALPRVPALGGLGGDSGLWVLSFDRGDRTEIPADAGASVAAAALRAFDLVVLDLARSGDDGWRTWWREVDLGLVVVRPSVRAASAASRVVADLDRSISDLRLVVRGPTPRDLPAEAVAEALGLPLLGELRSEPGLEAALQRGEPPGLRARGPLARCATRVLAELPDTGWAA